MPLNVAAGLFAPSNAGAVTSTECDTDFSGFEPGRESGPHRVINGSLVDANGNPIIPEIPVAFHVV